MKKIYRNLLIVLVTLVMAVCIGTGVFYINSQSHDEIATTSTEQSIEKPKEKEPELVEEQELLHPEETEVIINDEGEKVYVDAGAPVQETETQVTVTNQSDLRLMSAIIFAEAGNQCEAGKQAVGIVVMERVKSSRFSQSTVYDVIYAPGQFTPTVNGAMDKALGMYDSGTLPQSCIDAANYALAGNTTVNYNGTSYDMAGYLFFSRYVSGCRLQIGDHQFK